MSADLSRWHLKPMCHGSSAEVKKGIGREVINKLFGEDCMAFFNRVTKDPIAYLQKRKVISNTDTLDSSLIDDEEEEDIVKMIEIEYQKHLLLLESDPPKVTPKPINPFPQKINPTIVYNRNGTVVGYKCNAHNTKYNLQKSQEQPKSSSRCYAPLSNPGNLLDLQEVSAADNNELEIVSEIPRVKSGSQFYRPLMSPIPMFDGTSVEPTDTSHTSVMNGEDPTPSTSEQNSKKFFYGYTENERVRLKEKAHYRKLMDKMINRPVKVTEIEGNLTQDDDEESPWLPYSKKYLHEPLRGFQEPRYTPIKLVTKTSSQQKKSSEVKEKNAVKLPRKRPFRHGFEDVMPEINKEEILSPMWIRKIQEATIPRTVEFIENFIKDEAKFKPAMEEYGVRIKKIRMK